MALLNDHEGHRDFLRHYSSAVGYRNLMLDDLLVTPIQDLKEFRVPENSESACSNTTATVRSHMRGMGVDVYQTSDDIKPKKKGKKSKKKK